LNGTQRILRYADDMLHENKNTTRKDTAAPLESRMEVSLQEDADRTNCLVAS